MNSSSVYFRLEASNILKLESYLRRKYKSSVDPKSFIATTSNSLSSSNSLNASLPILPNPLIATLFFILTSYFSNAEPPINSLNTLSSGINSDDIG